MTRTAIFSDVHGNLEALQAVQRAGVTRGVDAWLCLGDVVGYGADPSACLALTRSLADVILLGNHDAAVAGVQGVEYFNACARRAVDWTRRTFSAPELAFLAGLAVTHIDGEGSYVHADPAVPDAWHYVSDLADVGRALDATQTRLVYVGHTHVGFLCAAGGEGVALVAEGSGRVELMSDCRYLINVGSVGQPRDGDPRACFVLRDDETDTVELVRTDYDVAAAQAGILAAGLPPFLAERLGDGS